LAWCFAFPSFLAWYLWGETLWNGFLVAGMLRYTWTLHVTWSVNSIVHSYGESPYDPTERPSESRLVSLLAQGEGWHSWHHAYAFDYAAAELDASQQWNPTKVVIDICASLGLVWGRKRGHRRWEQTKEFWKKERPEEEMKESLHGPPFFKVRHIRWRSKAA